MTNWLKLAVLVVATVVVTQLIIRKRAPELLPSGTQAPGLVLPDLSGRSVDLEALRGKVVAVNFWATWCPPCRRELPDLAAVYREHEGRCFELLGVVEESARAEVDHASSGVPYPILPNTDASVRDAWGVEGYPVTFLVDAEGQVRRVFRGEVSGDQLAAAIAPLLPATCPRS
jgi:cytochrome c biogenesis protein CcmG, thiol:disulfide interchange protein DsbE